jgi:hypothetical protein
MSDASTELKLAKNILAEEKMLCSDATENNRNVILVALLAVLRRIWTSMP